MRRAGRGRRLGVAAYQGGTAALAGISALGLLRVLAPFLGFTVKINGASLMLSALLGVPGVALLLFLRVWFMGG